MKSLYLIGWATAILCGGSGGLMFYTFEHGIYSLGFVSVYGFISFFMLSVVAFRLHKQIKSREENEKT